MARKTKEQKTSPWRERLRKMKSYQDAHSSKWDRNLKLVFGKTESDEDTLGQCAYGWGLFQALVSSIHVHQPEMLLESYEPAKAEAAKMLNSIVAYDLDQMDMKSHGNMGILDNFTHGYAAIIETVETKKRAVRFVSDEGEKEAPKKKSGEDDEVDIIESQQYVARRIPPKDIMFDPAGTQLDLSDHRYIACAFYPSIKKVKDDPVFAKNIPENFDDFPEASTTKRAPAQKAVERNIEEKDPDFKTICVWEIFDKINHEIVYVTDHGKHELGRVPWPVELNINGREMFPVTILAFFPSPTGFYPIPLVELIAKQLEIINKLDSAIFRDATTKWRKFATWANGLTEDQQASLVDSSTDANSVITVSVDIIPELAGQGTHPIPDLHNMVVPIADPAVDRDAVGARELAISEIGDTLGFMANQRGGMPKTRSAREAMAIRERQDQRMNIMSDAITGFYQLFGQKHVLFLQGTMLLDRYTRIFTGIEEKLARWQEYTREDIEGSFHFTVLAGTSMPRNTEARRAQEMGFFNTVAPILMRAGYPIEPALIRLANVFQWKNIDELFKNYKATAKQLAKVLYAAGQGKEMPPEMLIQAATATVMASLSEAELLEVKQQLEGQMQGGEVPAPKSQRGDAKPGATAAGTF